MKGALAGLVLVNVQIASRLHLLRGQHTGVDLDRDDCRVYGAETGRVNSLRIIPAIA